MDNCFVDVTIEFLAVAFHNILYYTSVYPLSIFEAKRKYSIVVYQSKHPEINQYIDLSLKSIAECLKTGQLQRVDFIVTDSDYKPILNFAFDFEKLQTFDETSDAYLIKCEQNMRTFCLKLATVSHRFKDLPEDTSFMIYIHTNESTAVAMSANLDLEEFPLVEVEESLGESDKILPLKRLTIRQFNIDAYIELK